MLCLSEGLMGHKNNLLVSKVDCFSSQRIYIFTVVSSFFRFLSKIENKMEIMGEKNCKSLNKARGNNKNFHKRLKDETR